MAVGDSLYVRTVTDLKMSREAVNANDQLVFRAALDDGTQGVFVMSFVYVDAPIQG